MVRIFLVTLDVIVFSRALSFTTSPTSWRTDDTRLFGFELTVLFVYLDVVLIMLLAYLFLFLVRIWSSFNRLVSWLLVHRVTIHS